MKAAMMRTPTANSTAWRMCAPVSSKPSRIAIAQPPANAAPNTSAPIRIAALITVTTLGQTIWREVVGEVCELMGNILFLGRNLYEKGNPIKRKRPQKRPSHDIGCHKRIGTRTGIAMSETPQMTTSTPDQPNPLLKAWQTPFETPPFAELLPEHFLPAFEQAFADHAAEVA